MDLFTKSSLVKLKPQARPDERSRAVKEHCVASNQLWSESLSINLTGFWDQPVLDGCMEKIPNSSYISTILCWIDITSFAKDRQETPDQHHCPNLGGGGGVILPIHQKKISPHTNLRWSESTLHRNSSELQEICRRRPCVRSFSSSSCSSHFPHT